MDIVKTWMDIVFKILHHRKKFDGLNEKEIKFLKIYFKWKVTKEVLNKNPTTIVSGKQEIISDLEGEMMMFLLTKGKKMKSLDPKEVSKILKVSEKWVRMKCAEGLFETVKIGRQWRINESSLQAFLNDGFSESKNSKFWALQETLKGEKVKRSLAMFGDNNLKPSDRRNLGGYGYFLRKYSSGLEKYIIFWTGDDGKRKTETIDGAPTESELLNTLHEKAHRMANKGLCCPNCGYNLHSGEQGDSVTPEVILKQVFSKYLNTKKKKRSFGVIENRVKILSGYLTDVKKPVDLTMKRIYKLKEQMEKKSYRGSTINTYLGQLSGILEFAKDMGYVKEVLPIRKLKADTDDSVERRFVPAEKFWAIYDKVDIQYLKDMLIIGRICANRPGELTTLTQERVELNGDHSYFRIPKEIAKTHKEKYCRITEEIKPIFKRLEKERNGNEFVFNIDGRQVSRNRYCADIKKANIKAGIEKPYDMYELIRHSGITDAGHKPDMSLGKLMSLAGHTNPSTTAIYLHSIKGKDQAVTPEEIEKRIRC